MSLDVLAIGAHPDDVEIGCGGTLALLAERGRGVGILHLTAGEAGSRGSAVERRQEATRAAEALGAEALDFLDCGDGGLRRRRPEEDALIRVLRDRRPRMVLAPPPRDRHPDHGRAHRLVVDACFYAGLARRSPEQELEPHRPAVVFSYLGHDLAIPAFVVDVTGVWERKMAALDAYESQLHVPGRRARAGPLTKVASPAFRLAIEGRGRDLGLLVGAELGEGFLASGPLAVADPWSLLPQGTP